MDLQYFRQNLRTILHRNKITLNALSVEADLSEDTLRSILYGRSKDIRLSTIIKVADVLNLSLDEMVGRSIYSMQGEKLVRQIQSLPAHSLCAIQALIDLESNACTKSSATGKDYISVFVPTGNIQDGLFYDSCNFQSINLSQYPKDLKVAADFGFKITTSNFEPIYFMEDILLLSQKQKPNYNDTVLYLNQAGQIYLRKYLPLGLEPIGKFGEEIPAEEIPHYTPIGIVLKVVREFNIEQYR